MRIWNFMMARMAGVETMYARSNQGISDPCLAGWFAVLDGLFRLLLTWLNFSQSQESTSSASKSAERGYSSGNLVLLLQTQLLTQLTMVSMPAPQAVPPGSQTPAPSQSITVLHPASPTASPP